MDLEAVKSHLDKVVALLDWRHDRGALVLHENHEELSRFRGACVAADYTNTIGTFIKGLAWRERDFFAAFHLHHNAAFQHVNECMRIVAMNRIRSTRRTYDCDHQTFLLGRSSAVSVGWAPLLSTAIRRLRSAAVTFSIGTLLRLVCFSDINPDHRGKFTFWKLPAQTLSARTAAVYSVQIGCCSQANGHEPYAANETPEEDHPSNLISRRSCSPVRDSRRRASWA